MVKKLTASITMAAALREVLQEKPQVTSAEMIDELKRRHPALKINKGSFSVAFYTTRQRMGLTPKKRSTRVRRRMGGVDLGVMRGAASFIRQAGGCDQAVEAIKAVDSLQLT